jgi:hypothetical protein
MDAADHQRLASWWCEALGYVRREDPDRPRDPGWPVPIVDPAGNGPLIWVIPVPEPKTVKNRMHIDLFGDVDELVRLGARVVRPRDDEIDWDVMADPEGSNR